MFLDSGPHRVILYPQKLSPPSPPIIGHPKDFSTNHRGQRLFRLCKGQAAKNYFYSKNILARHKLLFFILIWAVVDLYVFLIYASSSISRRLLRCFVLPVVYSFLVRTRRESRRVPLYLNTRTWNVDSWRSRDCQVYPLVRASLWCRGFRR